MESHLAQFSDAPVMMQYWPIFAFTFALFVGSVGTAIGATMWLAGKLSEQDGKRIELKEAILLEMRETRHSVYGRVDQQYSILSEKLENKANELMREVRDLSTRITKVETSIENGGKPHSR